MKKQTVQVLPTANVIDNLKKLFNPARAEGETQREYKIRRKNASTYHDTHVVKANKTKGGTSTSRERHRSNLDMSKYAGHYSRYLRDFVQAKNLMKIRYGS